MGIGKNGLSGVWRNNSAMIWIKRLIGIFLFLILYFTALRPLRNRFSSWVVDWITGNNSADYILTLQVMVRSFIVEYQIEETVLTVAYIPQFGFFFLMGMVGVIWFQPGPKVYGALVSAQLIFEFLVLGLLWVGYQYTVAGLITANLLMVYLSPMVCLGFILFLYLQKKGKLEGLG